MSHVNPPWLADKNLQHLFALVASHGGELRAVGGCVRDYLLGVPVGDVDLCTSLPPDAVMTLCAAHHIKAVPTGIAHGTVTVVLEGKAMEVTSLRRDVETDGRHAVVAYTNRFEEDAARRDFTINALSVDATGTLYDYFSGREDLAQQHLRFIGAAEQRITEDALRILRYFRFLATLGWQADAAAVTACKAHAAMLERLSGERIQQEMKKLLPAPNPMIALQHMMRCGLPKHLATGEWNLAALPALLTLESGAINPWARLLTIAPSLSVEAVSQRWKLSNADKKLCTAIADFSDATIATVKEALRQHPRTTVRAMLQVALAKNPKADSPALLKLVEECAVPVFPVTAGDVMAKGIDAGPGLGAALKRLETHWVESDYRLTKPELLALL